MTTPAPTMSAHARLKRQLRCILVKRSLPGLSDAEQQKLERLAHTFATWCRAAEE